MKKTFFTVLISNKPNLNLSNESLDERVFFENGTYEDIFGVKFKEQGNLPSRRGIVKVSISSNKRKIYRLFAGGNKVSGNEVGLTGASMQILDVEDSTKYAFILSKACWFQFMWHHPAHSTRIAYRISIWAFFVGIVSIVLTAISLFID